MTTTTPIWILAPLIAALVPLAWTWGFVWFMHARFVRYMRHTGRPLPQRSWRAWLAVWAREVRNLLLTQAFHLTAPWAARRTVVDVVQGHPVLCVHGFTQNGTNFRRIRHALRALGRESESITMGYPPRALDRYTDRLEARLEQMTRASDTPVDVVAHSMGGIVLRRTLQRRPDLAARIGRVVTLGTPHAGTGSARGIPLPETRFMGRRSDLLGAMPSLVDLLPHAAITTVGGLDDTTVYPEETTCLEGAAHVALPGLGHAGILVDHEAVAVTLAALQAPMPASSRPAPSLGQHRLELP